MGKAKKTSFLITPLGDETSPTRIRADEVCDLLLAPLLAAHDLELVRGDRIAEQGNVMVQVVREILDAAAVVADLTGLNPNVLYELGIADAFRKPVLRLIDEPRCLPFDFRVDRTLPLRSTESGNLVPDDVKTAEPPMRQFLADALNWDHRVSNTVTEAIGRLPTGFGEVGFMRAVGGYQLANGWSGVEKALRAAGCNMNKWRENAPSPLFPNQYSVNLIGALASDIAEIRLAFGDWMEQEVEAYLSKLIKVLVDCGSPYRVVAEHCDRRYVAEPGGELQVIRF